MKRTKNSQDNLKNKAERLSLPDNRVCYKTTVIRLCHNSHEDRQMDLWNRIKSPETA